jgi:hypothetical protein
MAQLLVNKNVEKANDGDEDHCNKYKVWDNGLLAIGCTFHIILLERSAASTFDLGVPTTNREYPQSIEGVRDEGWRDTSVPLLPVASPLSPLSCRFCPLPTLH